MAAAASVNPDQRWLQNEKNKSIQKISEKENDQKKEKGVMADLWNGLVPGRRWKVL